MTGDKASALPILSAELATREADYHLASEDTTDVLAATIGYLESTQDSIAGIALAEVAYAFLAGYEHATGNTDATRPVFALLRKAGLSL